MYKLLHNNKTIIETITVKELNEKIDKIDSEKRLVLDTRLGISGEWIPFHGRQTHIYKGMRNLSDDFHNLLKKDDPKTIKIILTYGDSEDEYSDISSDIYFDDKRIDSSLFPNLTEDNEDEDTVSKTLTLSKITDMSYRLSSNDKSFGELSIKLIKKEKFIPYEYSLETY